MLKKGEEFSREVSFYDELCGGSYNFLCKFRNVRAKIVKKFLNRLRRGPLKTPVFLQI